MLVTVYNLLRVFSCSISSQDCNAISALSSKSFARTVRCKEAVSCFWIMTRI